MIDVYVEGLSIDIGRQGENLAKNIYFDLSELINTYGEGTATLVHMRPSDKAPYVCAVTRIDTFLIWTPTSTDTSYAGAGKCELRWVVGDVLAKSIVYRTFVAESITGDSTVPSEYESWYEALLEHISKYEIASDRIEANAKNIATNTNEIAVLDGRMDEFTKLPDGSTTGDAELADIRVGADGTVYNNAGNAVRGQVTDLKSALNTVNDGYYSFNLIPDKRISRDNGNEVDLNGWSATDFIEVPPNSLILYYGTTNLIWGAKYDAEKTYVSLASWNTQYNSFFNDTGSTIFFRTSGSNADMASVKFSILPTVDASLTKTGYPADAKTVGDRLSTIESAEDAVRIQINDVKSAIDDINSENFNYTLNLTPNKYVNRNDGTLANENGSNATDYILVKPGQRMIVETPTTLSWGARYDKNKTYIEPYGWASNATYFNSGTENVYFRLSIRSTLISDVHITILPVVDTTLTKQGYPADSKTVGDRLSAIVSSSGVIPSYYETQIATKEATIRGHLDDCAYNGDGLIFLTDTHFSTDLFTSATPTSYFNANNSFSLIEDIFKRCAIDKIVFGGDLVNSAPDIDTMLLCMASFGARFGDRQARLRYCIGNHEYFTGSDLGKTTKPTPAMLYGAGVKYNEDVVLGKGDMDTYYFDNAVQKIRYFVVSCGRDTETSAAQVKWVLKQFEEIPQGYKVICIGHGFMADNMVAFRGGYKPIADALDAVKVGGTYTYVYGANISETYDYSALVDVTPVCMITGHTHIDGSIVTTGGIPCICTTTDSYAQNYELVNGTPTIVKRQKGTVNEQAFDIYQFDFTNRKIYVTRIGYGSDREFSY